MQTISVALAVAAFIAAVNVAPGLMFWITVPAGIALIWWVLYAPARDRERILLSGVTAGVMCINEARAIRNSWASQHVGTPIVLDGEAEYLGEWRGGRFV